MVKNIIHNRERNEMFSAIVLSFITLSGGLYSLIVDARILQGLIFIIFFILLSIWIVERLNKLYKRIG
ncbi:MAG: hypothetical protein AABX66_00810 [Nanoarchaeota archaeon]